jgi:hypothetical protein
VVDHSPFDTSPPLTIKPIIAFKAGCGYELELRGFIPEQFFLLTTIPISPSDETTHTHGCQEDSPGSLWNNSRALDVKSDNLFARNAAPEWYLSFRKYVSELSIGGVH